MSSRARVRFSEEGLMLTDRKEEQVMKIRPTIGEKVQMSDMAAAYPDEYVFATSVDNNHPDFPNDFWIYYVDHCRFEEREDMWKMLLDKGYHTHWYRTTPNRELTSVGLIGSIQ